MDIPHLVYSLVKQKWGETMIFTKELDDCIEINSIYGCKIRELIHPQSDPINISYSLAHGRIAPGESGELHHLKKSNEVYFILKGEGRIRVGDKLTTITEGTTMFVPRDEKQLTNIGDQNLEFHYLVEPFGRMNSWE